jgi:ureidoglycolate lyase
VVHQALPEEFPGFVDALTTEARINYEDKTNIMTATQAIEIPLIMATNDSLKGYGYLIDTYDHSDIEIVTWPKQGWRDIDQGTGNEGGTTEGSFDTWWEGSTLYGQNNAVQHKSQYDLDGQYILAYSSHPERLIKNNSFAPPHKMYIWHVNYHPDGGQLFFPTQAGTFIAPLALPGDDIKPEDFKAFYFDGTQGLYIHPNIWHEGVFPVQQKSSFMGRQGKVHARVSVDLKNEFNQYIFFKTHL